MTCQRWLLFVVDPGAVLGASPSMLRLARPATDGGWPLGLCSVSPWVGICLSEFRSPEGSWNETDSLIVFCVLCLSEDCSSRFQGERVKLTEDYSLLFAGYVGPSQVMYGIQAAAVVCPFVACAGPLELFVGWQPQSAARTLRAMIRLLASVSVL